MMSLIKKEFQDKETLIPPEYSKATLSFDILEYTMIRLMEVVDFQAVLPTKRHQLMESAKFYLPI